MPNSQHVRHMLTRLSLAVIFVGIGAWEVLQPGYWSAFVPPFAAGIAPINTLVMAHGVMLLAVGLSVLAGAYLRVASAAAVLIMLSILGAVVMKSGFTDLVVRDLAVLLIALALFFDDTKYMRLTD